MPVQHHPAAQANYGRGGQRIQGLDGRRKGRGNADSPDVGLQIVPVQPVEVPLVGLNAVEGLGLLDPRDALFQFRGDSAQGLSAFPVGNPGHGCQPRGYQQDQGHRAQRD